MAYPSIHYGNFGDEKVTATAKINSLPLGMKMVLPDGREFVHARVGGTAMVAGKLYQAQTGPIALADTMYAKSLVPSGTLTAGATTVAFTTGGTTAVTTNAFQDGFLTIAGTAGTGTGYTYKIKSNNSAAAGSATCTLTLYETDGIEVALVGATAGSSLVGVAENKYAAVELSLASTVGHPLCGVACNSAAASAYVWLQTKGPAAVFTGGTVLRDREACVCSTAVAGAVVAQAVAATTALLDCKQLYPIGYGLSSAGTAGYALVDLAL